ncbi:hypothetical protein D9M71_616430 [compost metagenome]
MTFDFFQQLGARQAGRQGIRGQVQGEELDDVVMCAVANRWARADVPCRAFAVGATHALERGLGADTRRNLVGAGLDAVMHPMVDTLAFLAIRIVHDDGVAERACRTSVPVQCWRDVVPTATLGIAGGGRREQSVIRDARDVQGETLLGRLRRKLHAKGDCHGR